MHTSKRSTAEETRLALTEALLRLLRDSPVEAISVRDIATEAQVNHGLVHRYFGSKDELVKAAVRRVSEEIFAGAPGRPGMSAWTFRYFKEHPHLAGMVARACFAGQIDLLVAAAPSAARQRQILAPLRKALDRAGMTDLDAATVNGFAAAAFLGWFAFRPLLGAAFGVKANAERDIERLLEMLDTMVAGASA